LIFRAGQGGAYDHKKKPKHSTQIMKGNL
jgi:hypothetical protein